MPTHPAALVSPEATVHPSVVIGPFAIIEEGVVIAEGCSIAATAQILKGTKIGADCEIGPGTVIGGAPQVRGFDQAISSGVSIGDRCVIREHCTIHRSATEGGQTILGDDNMLMVGCHLGHDCIVGNFNTMANGCAFGGHAIVANHCFFGGGSMFHQFVRIGSYVMTQGHSGISQDLPPYTIGAKINEVSGVNAVGLSRGGFTPATRKAIKDAFVAVYRGSTPLKELLESARTHPQLPEVQAFYDFLAGDSKKGLCIRLRH